MKPINQKLINDPTSDLLGFDFSDDHIHGVSFAGRDLTRANFSNCKLTLCDFTLCNLSAVNMINCTIDCTCFAAATMTNIDLDGSEITNSNIKGVSGFDTVLIMGVGSVDSQTLRTYECPTSTSADHRDVEPIIGQECICSDGLGRVRKVTDEGITVDTYVDNRGCCWAPHNVKLLAVKSEHNRTLTDFMLGCFALPYKQRTSMTYTPATKLPEINWSEPRGPVTPTITVESFYALAKKEVSATDWVVIQNTQRHSVDKDMQCLLRRYVAAGDCDHHYTMLKITGDSVLYQEGPFMGGSDC